MFVAAVTASSMIKPRSLGGSLGLAAALAFIASALLSMAVFLWLITGNSTSMVRDGLMGQAEDVRDAIRRRADGTLVVDMHEPMRWGYDAFFQNLKYRVLDPKGTVLASSEGDQAPLGPISLPRPPRATFAAVSMAGGGVLHVATVPVEVNGEGLFVQTARSDRFVELANEAVTPAVLESAAVVALVSSMVFSVVVTYTLRRTLLPLLDLSDAAASIRLGHMSQRLPTVDVPREINPLVNAFNGALDRIEEGIQVQRRFLADAAHELKTPLAVLRARLESGDSSQNMFRDVDHMARVVQQLLQLAEVSEPEGYRKGPIDVHAACIDIGQQMLPISTVRDVSLTLRVKSGLTVTGDDQAFRLALKNIVENAIRHSPPGGTVTLSADVHGLAVVDEGPGVSERDLPHLFERFWRSGDSEGTGIGLAIVDEVARGHGWTVAARNNGLSAPGLQVSVQWDGGACQST